MPNPRATTEACRSSLASEWLSMRNGCSIVKPNAIPPARAIAGETAPLAARRRHTKKMVRLFIRPTLQLLPAKVQAEIMMGYKRFFVRLLFTYTEAVTRIAET